MLTLTTFTKKDVVTTKEERAHEALRNEHAEWRTEVIGKEEYPHDEIQSEIECGYLEELYNFSNREAIWEHIKEFDIIVGIPDRYQPYYAFYNAPYMCCGDLYFPGESLFDLPNLPRKEN